GVRLTQTPIDEITSLRIPGAETVLTGVTVQPGEDPLDTLNLQHDMFELIATIDPQQAASVGFNVREGAGGEQTTVLWNRFIEQMIVDRSDSGDTGFTGGAGGVHLAPLSTDANGKVRLHALVDRGSIEVFGGDGEAVISNLIFPDPASQGLSLVANGSAATFESLEIYPLRSIWPETAAPSPGTPVVARWSMNGTPAALIEDGSYPAVIDRRDTPGEGTRLGTVNQLYEPNAAVDSLWFSSSASGGLPTSPETPPASMFAPAYQADTAGSSFDAGAMASSDGALFLPIDRYGEDAMFDDAFTVEMFFKTDGDQADAGLMQLMLAGEDEFRFGLIVNEGGAGNVRFALNDRTGAIPILDMRSATGKNFADGQWHYLMAVYDPTVGANGVLQMAIASEDGTLSVAATSINANFDGLPPVGGDGNLLVGRHNQSLAADDRTFRGLIDEVQLTDGVVPAALRLGRLAGFPLGGDFNADGRVDAADYTVWRDQFGQTGPGLTADADGNGVVDGSDYDLWVANFGAVSAAAAAVPEPGCLWLSLGVIAAASRRVRVPGRSERVPQHQAKGRSAWRPSSGRRP
ncbi:MAG: GH32 C-terminal domain-containing protein, partial [Planctomycetota bacterium]